MWQLIRAVFVLMLLKDTYGDVEVDCSVKNVFDERFVFMNNTLSRPNESTNYKKNLRQFSVYLLENIPNLYVNIDLSTALTKDRDDFRSFLNQTVNVCAITKAISRNFIFKILVDDIRDHANFELKCPFKKGFYEIKERELVTTNIPFFFTDTKFKLNMGVYTKSMKKLTMMFDIRHECAFRRF